MLSTTVMLKTIDCDEKFALLTTFSADMLGAAKSTMAVRFAL